MISLQKQVKKKDVPWRIIDGEAIIVQVDNAEVIHLNKVGTFIWKNIEGKKKISDLIEDVCQNFDVDKDSAKKDVLEFIDEMVKKDLISNILKTNEYDEK